jgi:DNA repair photolyase
MFMPPPGAGPGVVKGRGTVWAIEHRFNERSHSEFDDGWGTLEQAALEEQSAPGTQIFEENVRGILAGNDSPDVPFDVSINPYRGCEHGCTYCYARPTHSYLNLSPGLDFETRIIAKVNAAEKLREVLSSKGYSPSQLNIGSVTDAYQPAERRLKITRSVIEVLAEARHPFSIITKSSLVERDIDLIAPMAQAGMAAVYVSITTLNRLWRVRWNHAPLRRIAVCAPLRR